MQDLRKRNGEKPQPFDLSVSLEKVEFSKSETFFNNMALLVTDNNVFQFKRDTWDNLTEIEKIWGTGDNFETLRS